MNLKQLFIVIIALNLIIYIFLFPYTQALANQHINTGVVFRNIFFSLAIITILFAFIKYSRKKELQRLSLI